MDESLKSKEIFGELKVQRSKRVKPMSCTNTSVQVADDTIEVDTTQLFQRIICTVKIPDELKECFSYELASVPLSMFDEKRLMRKTKKSALYKMFNEVEEGSIPKSAKYVIDGGNLLHCVAWPKQGTFAKFNVYAAYVQFIRKNYDTEVTLIFVVTPQMNKAQRASCDASGF